MKGIFSNGIGGSFGISYPKPLNDGLFLGI
jgi:hypothetical protein